MTGRVSVATKNVQFDNAGVGTVPVIVSNTGNGPMGSDVSVVVVSPFYATFNRGAQPGDFFHEYIVANPESEPHVPEIMECVVPAKLLPAGGSVSFTFGLTLLPGGPRVPGSCLIGATPVGSDPARKSVHTVSKIDKPISPLPEPPVGSNQVNLFFSYRKPVLRAGQTRPLRVAFGNTGPRIPLDDPVFTLVTPRLTKVDRDDVAFSLLHPTYRHDRTDRSDVPDVVTVRRSRLRFVPDPTGLIDFLGLNTLEIPLTGRGRRSRATPGKGMLAAGHADFDTDKSVAVSAIDAMQLA